MNPHLAVYILRLFQWENGSKTKIKTKHEDDTFNFPSKHTGRMTVFKRAGCASAFPNASVNGVGK